MKILTIADNEAIKEIIKKHMPPLGFDFIFYNNPIKAMDNISEIEPDLVLFSAEDFPRHWKPFLKVLREDSDQQNCVFILLKTSYFTFEDAEKASYLGVNGLIDQDLDEHLFIDRVKGIFSRYILPKESRRERRYFVSSADNVNFIFNHPGSMGIISADVIEISVRGTTILLPEDTSLNLKQGDTIKYCTIKIEDKIITTDCTVFRNNYYTTLLFDTITPVDMDFLKNFFDKRVYRELKSND